MERMGRGRWRPWPDIRRTVEELEQRGHRPGQGGDKADKGGTRVKENFSFRMERIQSARNGSPAMPYAVPVPCIRRRAVMPALPEERRHVPWRTVQHSVIRAPYDDGGARMRASSGGVRTYHRRRAHICQPSEPGQGAAWKGASSPPSSGTQSGCERHRWLLVRRHRSGRL